MATKIEGNVICKNVGGCGWFFHFSENGLLQLLDADFNVIDNEINAYTNHTQHIQVNILCKETKYYHVVTIGMNTDGYYINYSSFQCPSIPKLNKHYNLCFGKYTYKQIDNYYCKIPKDNMIFWQDNKDSQYKYI